MLEKNTIKNNETKKIERGDMNCMWRGFNQEAILLLGNKIIMMKPS